MPFAPFFRYSRYLTGGIFAEACGVALAGILLALAANRVSPRGLSLTRDYFPSLAADPGSAPAVGQSSVNPVTARLRERGFQVITGDELLALFRDPRHVREQVVIVDARGDEHYQRGHIPGAFQFDHYRAADFLPVVLPVCRTAEKIAVYCTGGDCEDSEHAVALLVQAGIPRERLWISPGGMAEWSARRNPIETGPRLSGIIQPAAP